MTAAAYVPPNVIPPPLQRVAPLLKRKWFRELVLLPPTLSRRRFSNKTEDYGVFKPSQIAHIGQLSIYVQDIDRSRRWYEQLGGFRQSRTCEQEPHPFKPGWTIRCCYMSAAEHEECLVLIEERDPDGKITVPSGMSYFHTAFELAGNRLEDCSTLLRSRRRRAFGPITDRCATTASRRLATARPAATSPRTTTIRITTTSNSAPRWTQSKTMAPAMATPRARPGHDAARLRTEVGGLFVRCASTAHQ